MIDPDIPVNDGFYQVIELLTTRRQRPRFASGRRRSAAARTRSAGCARPRCGRSRGSCPSWLPPTRRARCSTSRSAAANPRTGGYFVYYETQAGGYGGRLGLDGMDGVQPHVQNTENAPIEETESNYPVRFLRYALIPDSEGPGRWRGGLGLRRDYVFEGDVTFSVMAERVRFAPQGLLGRRARRARTTTSATRRAAPIRYPSKFSVDLAAGEVMSIQSGGGGGYGEVGLRDPGAGRGGRRGRADQRRAGARRLRRIGDVERDERRSASPSTSAARSPTSSLVDEATGGADDRQGAHHAGRPVGRVLPRARPGADERRPRHRRDCRSVLHATTVATNAVITRTGGPAALIATEGFRDVLEIARQIRHDLYDLRTTKPAPARAATVGARGPRAAALRRLRATCRWTRRRSGAVAERLRGSGIRSVAVCLLHAYVNPAHEQRVARDPARGAARPVDLAVERHRARDPRVPAGQHDRRQRLRRAGRRRPTSSSIERGLRERGATPGCG